MGTLAAERKPIAMRIPARALEEIDRQAAHHGLSRTEFVVKASTGELPHTTSEAIQRIEALEAEVQRLKDLAYG